MTGACVLAFVLTLSPLAGCRPAAPAGRYQKDGLSFEHLAGWSVTDDSQKKARHVSVEGPRHAILSLSIFAAHLEVSLESFVEATTNARSAGVKKRLTVAGVNLGAEDAPAPPTPIERSIAGTPARGLQQHFTLKVIHTAVPHTTEFLIVTLADHPVILMDQTPDEDRAAATPGLQKIFDTLALAR